MQNALIDAADTRYDVMDIFLAGSDIETLYQAERRSQPLHIAMRAIIRGEAQTMSVIRLRYLRRVNTCMRKRQASGMPRPFALTTCKLSAPHVARAGTNHGKSRRIKHLEFLGQSRLIERPDVGGAVA